jgi:hypothetical protein
MLRENRGMIAVCLACGKKRSEADLEPSFAG